MSDKTTTRVLPAPESASLPAVPELYTVAPSYAYGEREPEDAIVPLSHYLWILRRHKWRILAFVLVAVISTIVVSARLTPIYEAIATVDIDRQAPAGVIGQDALRMAPNDSDQFLATQIKLVQSDSVLRDQFLATQIKLVQSDSVLRPVAERYKLHLVTTANLPGQPAL